MPVLCILNQSGEENNYLRYCLLSNGVGFLCFVYGSLALKSDAYQIHTAFYLNGEKNTHKKKKENN